MPQAGGARCPAECSRRSIQIPGKLRPGREIRPSTCSDRNIPHGEKANKKSYDRRKGTSHRGMHPPFSLQQVSPPGPVPHDRKPTPPAGSQMEALRPGPGTLKADTALSTKKHVPPGSECCVCAHLPRENAFLRFPAGKAAAFSPCLREENKKKPCRRTKCALKLQGFKRRKAPETGAFPKITLASAYFPT